jgi:hypothetical protein
MKLQDLNVLFRKQMADEVPPYLWDDDELLQYAVDAQNAVVRAVGGLVDTTTAAICNLTVTANQPWVTYNPLILHLRSGFLTTSKRDVFFGSEGELREAFPNWDYGWTYPSASINDDTYTGPTAFGILGMQENQLRMYPVPDTSETLRVRVYRLPYPGIVDQQSVLEVDAVHHIHLVKGMRASAYLKHDTETYDPKAAERFQASFDAYCEKARKEAQRKRDKPRFVRSSWPTGARRTHF